MAGKLSSMTKIMGFNSSQVIANLVFLVDTNIKIESLSDYC